MEPRPDPVEQALRETYAHALANALLAARVRLQRQAHALDNLHADALRLAVPGDHGGITPESLVHDALQAVHRDTPDLAGIAYQAQEYRLRVDGYLAQRAQAAEALPVAGDTCLNSVCSAEPLPGLPFCWEHLLAEAVAAGGRVFPIGSPEPTEAEVGSDAVLVGWNGVRWSRSQWDDWRAGGPAGDGTCHAWREVNGTGSDGAMVVLLPDALAKAARS